jgi:hypothetical protein
MVRWSPGRQTVRLVNLEIGNRRSELAHVVIHTWDQGEWHNTSENAYGKANRQICHPIDESMDAFIKPIIGYAKTTLTPQR